MSAAGLRYELLRLPHLAQVPVDSRCQGCQRRCTQGRSGYCWRCFQDVEVVDPWLVDPLWLAMHVAEDGAS